MAAFVAVFFATQRVVVFLPFFVVARWTILPAPGTVTRVVTMTAFLVTFTFALVVVKAVLAVGLTAADGADAGEVPPALVAVAVKV